MNIAYDDIGCYARMKGTVYFIGHYIWMAVIQCKDGTRALQLMLTPENIKQLLVCAKEAGLEC